MKEISITPKTTYNIHGLSGAPGLLHLARDIDNTHYAVVRTLDATRDALYIGPLAHLKEVPYSQKEKQNGNDIFYFRNNIVTFSKKGPSNLQSDEGSFKLENLL